MDGGELERFVVEELKESRFRAGQIGQWLARGADIDGMTNLSAALRKRLSEVAVANPVRILESYKSQIDETEKFLYALTDGNLIEGVLMRYHHGDTLCVSTQVGCRMGCAFCASTLDGRVRNLTPGEILGQVAAANRHIQAEDPQRRVHNIVLMGSGEPLDNYDNVVRFLKLVNAPEGLNISLRNISLSTCGLVPNMYRLAEEGLQLTLSVSLHAADDETRSRLMPVNRAYPVDDLLDACRRYFQKTGRRISYEYALIDGVNDTPRHARLLADRLAGTIAHVNLIPLNHVEESPLRPSRRVAAFQKQLEERGITATVRRRLGSDIDASCGQLRRKAMTAGRKGEDAG